MKPISLNTKIEIKKLSDETKKTPIDAPSTLISNFCIKFPDGDKLPSLTRTENKPPETKKKTLSSLFGSLERKRRHLDQNEDDNEASYNKKCKYSLLQGHLLEDDSKPAESKEESIKPIFSSTKPDSIVENKYFKKLARFADPSSVEIEPSDSSAYEVLVKITSNSNKLNMHKNGSKNLENMVKKGILVDLSHEHGQENYSLSNSFVCRDSFNRDVMFSAYKMEEVSSLASTRAAKAENLAPVVIEKQKEAIVEEQASKSTNGENELRQSLSGHNLNIFDGGLDAIPFDNEFINSIYNDIMVMNNNNNGTDVNNNKIEESEPSIGVFAVPSVEETVLAEKAENPEPINEFEDDPRYKYYLDKFTLLIIEILKKVCLINLEQINYSIANQPASNGPSTTNKTLAKLTTRRTKIQAELKLASDATSDEGLYSKIYSLFELQTKSQLNSSKKSTFLFKPKSISTDYTLALLDYFKTIKTGYEQFEQFSYAADFQYFIEFKLFMYDILADVLPSKRGNETSQLFCLDEPTNETISSILKPITQEISGEVKRAKDSRKKSDHVEYTDLNLIDSKAYDVIYSPNAFISVSKDVAFNEKLYKKQKYENMLSLNELEIGAWKMSSAETDSFEIEEDLSEIRVFEAKLDENWTIKEVPLIRQANSSVLSKVDQNSSFMSVAPPPTPVYKSNDGELIINDSFSRTPKLSPALENCSMSSPVTPVLLNTSVKMMDSMLEHLIDDVRTKEEQEKRRQAGNECEDGEV